jgi:flagellar basal-body rod modification protein FlgD
MEISSTDLNTTQASANAGQSPTELKNQFLTLLVAQLKNQDPTKPVENQEFVAQLAQLTSLEQQAEISQTNASLLLQSSLSTGAALIGKSVEGHVSLGDQTVNIEGEIKSVNVERGEVIYKVEGEDGTIHSMRADQIVSVTEPAVQL